ncbi:MAG: single-stranded DNA-binding protein [Bacteroidota bacterium]|jgi:single-strand DNA-binding protein
MNNLRNSVRLIGNLGMNPEIKEAGNKKKLAKFSLATSETYKNNDGEQIKDTTWHNVVAWGNQARIAEMYLKKGSEVAIEGKITNRNYTDKNGVKRFITEIMVNEILMVSNAKS